MFHRLHEARVSRISRTSLVSVAGLVAAFAFGASAVQCSSDREGFEDPARVDAAVDPSPFAPDGGTDAAATDNPLVGDCQGENKQIFVVSPYPDAIYRFDPENLSFTLLGKLDCPSTGAFSMAIDRHGVAWVLFSSGVLVNVDLHDFRCTEVLVRGLPPNVALFGMAFAKDDTQTGESLYVLNSDLMRIDPITHDATVRGRTKMPGWGELTGTGDGQLYGYSPYNGVILHFDKSNGASLKDYRTSALDANDWAFAQWGGDFWIFKRVDPAKGASVYRYSPKTDETTLVLENGPVRVIGAGSSTCAPFQPVE